jgi:hypothetical protein
MTHSNLKIPEEVKSSFQESLEYVRGITNPFIDLSNQIKEYEETVVRAHSKDTPIRFRTIRELIDKAEALLLICKDREDPFVDDCFAAVHFLIKNGDSSPAFENDGVVLELVIETFELRREILKQLLGFGDEAAAA